MKILILANHDLGLYQFRKELIQELLKKGEVFISLPTGRFIKDFEKMGCKFIETPVDRRGINPLKDLELMISYYDIVKRIKPDLVITYTIKPNVYGGIVCRLLKCEYAINITGLGTAFEKEGLLKKLVIRMYKVACKKAKVVFFENEENRCLFIENGIINSERACKLNGAGVNLERYKVEEYPTDEKVRFLFMGRVMAEKGINELFVAMKRLISNGVNCELDVLGEYEENYREAIRKYEQEDWLHYYGYQKDVRPFIKRCHCFVLPSWHEGMANTNLECAASGRPVITTKIHGCMEAVIDGKTGFLVARKDSADLCKAMKKFVALSNDEARTMGLAGRKHMENWFDKNKVVHETIAKLMQKVINKKQV